MSDRGTSDRTSRLRTSYLTRVLWWDGALAVLAIALSLAATFIGVRINERTDTPTTVMWHGLFWSAALAAALAFRRRFPASSFVAVSTVFAIHRWLTVPEYNVSAFVFFISLCSAGSWIAGARRRLVARCFGVGLMAAVLIGDWIRSETPPEFEGLVNTALAFSFGYNLAFFLAGWVLGDIFRTRREREAALVERTQLLEVERELRARRAVIDERVRIARELHDVVAHHVSVMGVQAGGARRVLERDPAAAATALGTIEASSRQAIDELRRLVAFLRTEGDEDPLMPQPGLDRMPELIADARGAGLDVEHVVEGEPRPVPGSIDVSAYRVVQEALTNTRKHAGASHVAVTVRYDPDAVEVEVVDDGRGLPSPAVAGTGHGIAGMRERVALHGGELDVGRVTGRGYRVRARFPVRVAS